MSANRTAKDVGGPMVALCGGQRCAALWLRHGGGADLFDAPGPAAVKRAVGAARGAVLIRLQCVDRCHEAPVAALAHREAGTARGTDAHWITSADSPGRTGAMLTWVAGAAGGADPLVRRRPPPGHRGPRS